MQYVRVEASDICDPQGLVIREIALVDLAILQRDLVSHRMANSIARTTFDLRFNHIRVYRNSTIDGAYDFLNYHFLICVARNLNDLCNIRIEGFVDRDALAIPFG